MRTLSTSLLRLSLPVRAAALPLALAVGLAACSDDGGGTGSTNGGADAGTDGAARDDSGAGGQDSGAAEPLNGCTTYEDRTADGASRTLTWDFSISSSPDRCIRIKAGQTVTYEGSLEAHPLEVQGGDSPSPISDVDPDTGEVTFPTAGTFGWVCGVHPAMIGAVDVVE